MRYWAPELPREATAELDNPLVLSPATSAPDYPGEMDPRLRQAWTEIVTADDYDEHMASIGQAQASAALTRCLVELALVPADGSVVVAGAGTGQMFEFVEPGVFRPYRLTCADLNPAFLARLRERLARCGLQAEILEDDIENTSIEPGPDLLLATLLLEHIGWERGVQAFAALRPAVCAVILQENPAGMSTAVTPGRRLPPSLAKAAEIWHPALVPKEQLIQAMEAEGYSRRETLVREVADGKRLVGLLFARSSLNL
jgi:SAM-dependent methyltransferase